MSTQEERFAQIAAAIREKDGTTAPIKALDFAARIRAISTQGGGGDFAVPLVVTVDAGAVVTATHGETTVTATSGANGTATLILTAPGVWGVTAALGDKEKSTEIEVIDGYSAKFMLSSKLPDGYTEVEYIESSGTQNIDTGVVPTTKFKVQMDVEPLNIGTLFGCVNKVNNSTFRRFAIGITATNSIRIFYANIYRDITVQGTLNKRVSAYLESDGSIGYYGFEEIQSDISGNGNFDGMPTLCLLSSYILGAASGFIKAKLYSCQLHENGNSIRDFVPCINPSGTAGLFDLVEEKFYSSAGTGAFTPGPDV